MKYKLQVDIGYDENRWSWDEFYREREKFYKYLITKFSNNYGKVSDVWAVFENGTPELVLEISKICVSKGYKYNLGTGPIYSSKDIREARFLRFAASGIHEIDNDLNGVPLNKYPTTVCNVCGRVDDSDVSNPYYIYEKHMKKRQDIFPASMVKILSYDAFDKLRDDLEPWVKFGNAQVLDKNKKLVRGEREYVWIWPKYEVGPYVNMAVEGVCEKCKKPLRIWIERSGDIFKMNLFLVTSFKKVEAPIVRAGNWIGKITPQYPNSRIYDFFISPALFQKMQKLKIRGLVATNEVIHAADEPYDWDPLKDRPL